MKQTLIFWAILAIAITGLSGMSYLLVQQSIRIQANDIQVQMAEDTAASIQNGANPLTLIPLQKVDIATSLAPYMIIYNTSRTILASSAVLEGAVPTLPAGVFDYTRQNLEDRFTWQPQPGVRQAVVVRYFHTTTQSGYVLAGQSLKETEQHEDTILHDMLTLWIAILIATFVAAIVLPHLISEKE